MTNYSNKIPITIEKKLTPSPLTSILVPLFSIILSLLFGSIFFIITGNDPVEIYSVMFSGVFGSAYGIIETIVKSIPLLLAGLGLSIAFRMQLFNIGGEGQIYMGAAAATWIALNLAGQPAWLLLPLMMLAGGVAGGIWALIPAIPRAYLGVNEIITTLMLNYVAIYWIDYLVHGPWKDPDGYNFPITSTFSNTAHLPVIGDTRIHAGIIIGIILAVILHFFIQQTKFGYEIRIIGQSQNAARYAGMNIVRKIIIVMVLSGAVCGLTGMVEVSGIVHRLQSGFSPGYGYTAIIVAWLGRLNPLAIIITAVLFGGLQVGGYAVQMQNIPVSMVMMLQGSLLFFVLGGEILTRYRITLKNRSSQGDGIS
ncbi:MAG: ABC transporter permease [Clostridiales bacterium]|nr:ABC transporter permease [Clostridiales bacterium]MCF8021912.1 ABC transporter permease [Clostridiales bacterium]